MVHHDQGQTFPTGDRQAANRRLVKNLHRCAPARAVGGEYNILLSMLRSVDVAAYIIITSLRDCCVIFVDQICLHLNF